jgi:YesN/AraC family two-component response regulator
MRGKTLRTVLIIEEQADTRDRFIHGLEAEGFSTINAENGRVGIQHAQTHLPDVITCSLLMPEIDGYNVLTVLRQHPATAVIPFIVVTDKMVRTDLRKAMELGANDYLTKPCSVEELSRAIAVQLEKQSLLRQWYTEQPNSPILPGIASTTKSTFCFEPSWLSDPPLSDVFCFIEANYQQPITLSDVAQSVGYSPAYLTNLVGRQTGQTVQRWIIERRMAAARSLLLETDQSIEHIAAQVGYHHTVHFFRQFRQLHGTTPQVWRNAHRQQA